MTFKPLPVLHMTGYDTDMLWRMINLRDGADSTDEPVADDGVWADA